MGRAPYITEKVHGSHVRKSTTKDVEDKAELATIIVSLCEELKRSTAATDDQNETILQDYVKGDPNIHLELSGLAQDRKAPTVQYIQALRALTEVGVEPQKPCSLQKTIADLDLHKLEMSEKSV